MDNDDTINLLKECDAGSKMAVAIYDDVMDYIEDLKFKKMVEQSKHLHEKLGDKIHALLLKNGKSDKEPSLMAKGMSHMKTSMKIGMDSSDSTIADLVVEGCDMGIRSLYKYMHEYAGASFESMNICQQLIDSEDKLGRALRAYL